MLSFTLYAYATVNHHFICQREINILKKNRLTKLMAAFKRGDAPVKGRPLGFSEINYHLLIATEWHVGVVSTTQPLRDHDVLETCKILSQKQEVLRMCIVPVDPDQRDGSDFRFKPMEDPDKIDFQSTTVKKKEDWPALMRYYDNERKIDTANGPLWGFILAGVEKAPDDVGFSYEYVMLLKLSHAISDGKSTSDLLHRQFLPILSALTNGGDTDSVMPFVPQTRSVEEHFLTPETLKNPVPWYMRLGLNLVRWKNRMFDPCIPLFRFPDEENLLENELDREPECVPVVFGEEICIPLIEAAKTHGVTVHSVLLTAEVIAFCRTASAAEIILPKTIKQTWLIDLRKFLDFSTPQPLGMIIAVGITEHTSLSECSVEEFWQSCQGIASAVKTKSEKNNCTKWLGLMKYYIDAARNERLSSVTKETGMNACLSLSNLGNISIGPQPQWTEGPMKIRLDKQFFTVTGLTELDICFLIQFMATFENKFMWVVRYNLRRHSRRFVDTYLENLEEVLKTYCK